MVILIFNIDCIFLTSLLNHSSVKCFDLISPSSWKLSTNVIAITSLLLKIASFSSHLYFALSSFHPCPVLVSFFNVHFMASSSVFQCCLVVILLSHRVDWLSLSYLVHLRNRLEVDSYNSLLLALSRSYLLFQLLAFIDLYRWCRRSCCTPKIIVQSIDFSHWNKTFSLDLLMYYTMFERDVSFLNLDYAIMTV